MPDAAGKSCSRRRIVGHTARRVVHHVPRSRHAADPREASHRLARSFACLLALPVGARHPRRRARVAPPRAVQRDRRCVAVEWPPLAEARGDAPGVGRPLGLVFARGGDGGDAREKAGARGVDPRRGPVARRREPRRFGRPRPVPTCACRNKTRRCASGRPAAPGARAAGAPGARGAGTRERTRAERFPRVAESEVVVSSVAERRARRADVRERAAATPVRRGGGDERAAAQRGGARRGVAFLGFLASFFFFFKASSRRFVSSFRNLPRGHRTPASTSSSSSPLPVPGQKARRASFSSCASPSLCASTSSPPSRAREHAPCLQ